jgi:predicted nicotinamide N-methyase
MSTYRVRYQTVEIGGLDIHLRTLRDLNQYSDEQGLAARKGIPPASWPLFGVVWDSSQVLARYMLDYETEGLRILEVGCGIGLTSLLLQHRKADITATDRHPEVPGFLALNAKLNGLTAIPYVECDWKDQVSSLGRFDLILGSDLVYEPGHAELLSGFMDGHAKPCCEVVTVSPGRREQARFNRCMTDLGYSHVSITVAGEEVDQGQIQSYSRTAIACAQPMPTSLF